jgi:threonylcarbamoyladenosine tRNA methylthiotransferase MtaB
VSSVDASFPNRRKDEIFDYVIANFSPDSPVGPSSFSRSRFFLKVQDGCNHRCTYCIVWRTRGESRSVPVEELVARARQAVDDGYREIILTGVDLGSYGRDEATTLAALVRRLIAIIAPARLRLSSINANDFTDELIELTESPQFCRHLHIPLQSGSDRVLKRMGRLYRRRDYLALVAALRERSSDLALTTDVIIGFPGETEEDFGATQSMASEAGFSGMHVFRYSPRAGTAAPRLGLPIEDPVARQRSRLLQEQAETQRRAYETRFIGGELDVIWDRRFPNRTRGLSDNYITVYSPKSRKPLGSLTRVRPIATVADGLICADADG